MSDHHDSHRESIRRDSDTFKGQIRHNWMSIFVITIAVGGWLVGYTTTTNKVSEHDETFKVQESAIDGVKKDVAKVQTDVNQVKQTTVVLEERSRSQERDIQEIKVYLKEILQKVQ